MPGTGPEPVDELFFSRTLDGRYQLNGSFSAENGNLLAAALGGEVDRYLRAGRDGDPSVPSPDLPGTRRRPHRPGLSDHAP